MNRQNSRGLALSSVPVPDLQLTRDPLKHKSVALIIAKDYYAFIQPNTSPKLLSWCDLSARWYKKQDSNTPSTLQLPQIGEKMHGEPQQQSGTSSFPPQQQPTH